jgi:hypothetical protein
MEEIQVPFATLRSTRKKTHNKQVLGFKTWRLRGRKTESDVTIGHWIAELHRLQKLK